MLTNLHDAFTGQSRSPNMVPFHMLVHFPLEQLSSSFYDIRLQKRRDLETGSGVRQCHHAIKHIMTSYWRSIVTMAVSRVISEIFIVEKCRVGKKWKFWYFGASFTPREPVGVKFRVAKRTHVSLGRDKCLVNRCNESPLLIFGLWVNLIPTVCRFAAILPVINNK